MTVSEKTGRRSFGRHLRTRIVSGILVLVPVAITVFILRLVFASLSGFLMPVLRPFVGDLPPWALYGIAVASTLLLIYAMGALTAFMIGRRLLNLAERVILQVPLVKTIYSASKQVVDTFSASNRETFKATVIVEFPRPGSFAVGFVTGSILDPKADPLYRVFVPTTPNPTSGFLILLPPAQVMHTDISVEDGVKMIVSGGVLAPAQYRGSFGTPAASLGEDLTTGTAAAAGPGRP
jgi:uncharacterized membrane protein